MVEPMKENWPAMAASIAMHACLICLVIAASLAFDNRPGKVIEIDFSLVKDHVAQHPPSKIRKQTITRGRQVRGGGAPGKINNRAASTQNDTAATSAKEEAKLPPAPAPVTASDPRSEAIVHGGEAGSAQALGAAGTGDAYAGRTSGSGHGQGGSGGGRGAGHGSGAGLTEGGRDYNYIRDAIIKNIKYPDEAIRLDIEGKVVVSFIVLEDGRTSAIKVVGSSGYRLLDESTREAVATTRIRRKVPYRVVVHLPITYKLQG